MTEIYFRMIHDRDLFRLSGSPGFGNFKSQTETSRSDFSRAHDPSPRIPLDLTVEIYSGSPGFGYFRDFEILKVRFFEASPHELTVPDTTAISLMIKSTLSPELRYLPMINEPDSSW
jgi:hypothetical protein